MMKEIIQRLSAKEVSLSTSTIILSTNEKQNPKDNVFGNAKLVARNEIQAIELKNKRRQVFQNAL